MGAIAGFIAIAPMPASAQASGQACEFFSAPQRYNTQTNGNVIVIGEQPNRRYRVIITGENETTLAGIRACILDAFVGQSQLGAYIQVGSFEHRSDAETIQRILQAEGYPTRVVYRR